MILALLTALAAPPRYLTAPELAMVADTSRDGWTFWSVDLENPSIYTTRYVWANRRSEELLGFRREASRGKPFADLVVGAETEAGRRWVLMYEDALRSSRVVRLPDTPYDGKRYNLAIYPVSPDLVVVVFVLLGADEKAVLEVTDKEWLQIQVESLRALQARATESIDSIEDRLGESPTASEPIAQEPTP